MARTVRLYADDGGGGGDLLPVVFLHSTAGNATQWSAQLDHVRPERRAVALEWRGHGRSATSDDGDYSFLWVAADVEEAVKRLGIGRFVLVGHSGGGPVAVQYAADHPDRVAGLLLADPAGDARRDPQFRSLVVLVLVTLLGGTIFYSTVEGWSVVDALYFSVTTLTTVGLGDLAPKTTIGKIFTVIYISAGLSIIVGFIESVAKETLDRQRGGRDGSEEGQEKEGVSGT